MNLNELLARTGHYALPAAELVVVHLPDDPDQRRPYYHLDDFLVVGGTPHVLSLQPRANDNAKAREGARR